MGKKVTFFWLSMKGHKCFSKLVDSIGANDHFGNQDPGTQTMEIWVIDLQSLPAYRAWSHRLVQEKEAVGASGGKSTVSGGA